MLLHSSEYVSHGKKTRPSSLCFHMLHSPDNCMFAHSEAEDGQRPGLRKWMATFSPKMTSSECSLASCVLLMVI